VPVPHQPSITPSTGHHDTLPEPWLTNGFSYIYLGMNNLTV
jgi:hypothetical protein